MQGGLYVHIPFCTRRCPYCDFTLIESDGSLHEEFLGRLQREIDEAQEKFPGFLARTLHFGGGTPSLLKPAQVRAIVHSLRAGFSLPREAEVTLEANPEHIHPESAAGLLDAGITRLSLGIQSFDADELQFLGREHDPDQARGSFLAAREAGFRNINIDLMFGLPASGLEDWSRNLREAARLGPEHLSVYGLTYEPGTAITRRREAGEILPLDDEGFRNLYRHAMETLPEAGLYQYEISNFAAPGRESAHNLACWDRRPYLGFGPGAHSFIPEERWWNLSNVRKYLKTPDAVWRRESLTPDQQQMERVMLGLRQVKGIRVDEDFLRRHNEALRECVEGDLVRISDRCLRLTERGRCVADSVIERLTRA